MRIKRMSIRFNLDYEDERAAWERLQGVSGSKNKNVVQAINAFFGRVDPLRTTVRETIQDCFRSLSFSPNGIAPATQTLNEDDHALLEAIDGFIIGP